MEKKGGEGKRKEGETSKKKRGREDLACFRSGSVCGLVGPRRFQIAALLSAANPEIPAAFTGNKSHSTPVNDTQTPTSTAPICRHVQLHVQVLGELGAGKLAARRLLGDHGNQSDGRGLARLAATAAQTSRFAL